MNQNLIGDKKTFAVEYSVLMVDPSPPFGDCRLWFEGNFMGGIEGEVYLTRVCCSLEGLSSIKNKLFLKEELYNFSDLELFDLMQKEEIDETGKYWFMDTQGFDLFNKYVYRRNGIFHFLWKLAPEVQTEYEFQCFSTQLFFAQVAISEYEEVVKEFRNALMKLYKF